MSKEMTFKMTGEIMLRTISIEDEQHDFLFMDRRTGKTFKHIASSKTFTEVFVEGSVPQRFPATMTENSNFLKIVSFIKGGKIEKSYEPNIVSMTAHDICIKYYVHDSNLDSSGWWVDVKAMSNGVPNAHLVGSKRNQIINFVTELKLASEATDIELEGISSHRICEIWDNGTLKFSDHRFI